MKICLLPGDGIGVEIVDAAVEVLDAAAKNSALKLNMKAAHRRLRNRCNRRSPAGSNHCQC